MKINYLLLTALFSRSTTIDFAQKKKKTAEITPEQAVKNLYIARISLKTDGLFQKRRRTLIGKYFTRNIGELIWKDANSRRLSFQRAL
jgi:triphosphoribosyl-dephospho-CoA synthetase